MVIYMIVFFNINNFFMFKYINYFRDLISILYIIPHAVYNIVIIVVLCIDGNFGKYFPKPYSVYQKQTYTKQKRCVTYKL